MDWFGGRVSLGNLDLAGAVNKLSESVKNIERNFDTALFDGDKSESSSEATGSQSSTTNRKALFDPVIAFMGQKEAEAQVESEGGENISEVRDEESKPETPGQLGSTEPSSSLFEGRKRDNVVSPENSSTDVNLSPDQGSDIPGEQQDTPSIYSSEAKSATTESPGRLESDAKLLQTAFLEPNSADIETIDSTKQLDEEEKVGVCLEQSESVVVKVQANEAHNDDAVLDESDKIINTSNHLEEEKIEELFLGEGLKMLAEAPVHILEAETEIPQSNDTIIRGSERHRETLTTQLPTELPSDRALDVAPVSDTQGTDSATETEVQKLAENYIVENKEHKVISLSKEPESVEAMVEVEKLKREMKMMETALQGAARQAQAKADEIAKLMNENEHLQSIVDNFQRKSSEAAEIESLREEYHQRVATLERKVYALTKERDTLRREQNKKSDAAALLKEKDEIINQIMAEGEELSKKQAAQEGTIRKLRAQVRELEEEKKGLLTKLQVEENKVESIKKDKAATERLLQETIEKHQVELTAQKDYYTYALNAAKEAEALAEARANTEARTELEGRLRVAGEREEILVQALEELRQTLSRQEQQAAFREDMLRRDMEDLQRRYQASEHRCEELITQVPESTRPLLRQIEAMKETTDRRAEVWAAVERTLNGRLQEAEAKAAAAEERERSVNERLSQTLSRINVLEAQISCLRAEQTQLTRSLEKERQRAAENRQEYLAVKEESDTNEGRVNQLEEELMELKKKHRQELQESLAHRELLEQELEREKAARLELERKSHVQPSDQNQITKRNSATENGKLVHKLSTASSTGSMEESFFLQASLDSSDNILERRNSGEPTMSSYYFKSMTPSGFEAALRQKEGELASYMSRLATMESIRDSLAEELVKMTEQCEKLRTEAATLPGIRAELEALRRRHAAALELMGERDEEERMDANFDEVVSEAANNSWCSLKTLEELRADIIDLKEMYREQVNMLVNKIQVLSSQMGVA